MTTPRVLALVLLLMTGAGARAVQDPVPFQAPPGFIVDRVAGPPLVERPIMACFDDRGRLFVCDSAGVNLNAEGLLKNPPHSIKLLEDTDGDGKFDRSTVFADRLTFPQGALWHDGALYTLSAPSFWRLEDTDGDGVADRRTELLTGFGFKGNGTDAHGPFLSPSGRFHWIGRGFAIPRPDGSVLRGSRVRVLRARPDGSEIETLFGGGMDNPVEVAFTEEAEAFVTVALLHSFPRRIDGIIHGVEGAYFPWREDTAGEFKRTGDPFPSVTDLGWVAPSGLHRLRGGAFGPGYEGNLFSALFNTHRVQRHIVERHGATFRSRDEDFLVSENPDVHPTDVLEDADGSLLVVDTGGWFRQGCPTSRIAKPEVTGAIYRVRRKDAARVDDPRGRAIRWSAGDLTPLLDDPRFAVRDRAVEELARRGSASVEPLRDVVRRGAAPQARRNAVWALTRIGRSDVIREALGDRDASVRLAAAHAVGLLRDAGALEKLAERVVADEAPIRREAATALGRLRNAKAVPALLEGLRGGGDRFLEHALIFALIEIADVEGTRAGLAHADPSVRRGSLIALDQMKDGTLAREEVVRSIDPSHPALRREALRILTRRPGWAKEMTGLLHEWLQREDADEERREQLRALLAGLSGDPAIQELVARMLRQERTPVATRLILLEAIARAPLERLPMIWGAEVRWSLGQPDERVVRQAVATARSAALPDFDEALLALARNPGWPADLRTEALAAAAPRMTSLEPALFKLLRSGLDAVEPLARSTAAHALGSMLLNSEQLQELTRAVAKAGPLELRRLLAAYERRPSSMTLATELMAALQASPGLESLSPDVLRRTLASFPPAALEEARPLFARLEVDLEKQKARLAELESALSGGDAARGREVFFGKKASCAACHTIRSQGGQVGPDLSKIGAIRNPRDLLEAIVFPSASFVRGYEPFVVRTLDGGIHDGLIVRETAEAITLATPDRTEKRILRRSVEAIREGRVSIMPQGLDAQIRREELRDLIAFLGSLK